MNQDAEHLRLLSIFHYVYAGLIALGSCAALFFPFFFGFIAFYSEVSTDAGRVPAAMGVFFMVVAISVFLLALAIAGLTAYAGHCLAEHKHQTFCIVIAAISCLSFPFGTALGVFTIIVLQRPNVRVMFLKTAVSPA